MRRTPSGLRPPLRFASPPRRLASPGGMPRGMCAGRSWRWGEYPRAAAPNARSGRAHSLHLTSLHFTLCDSPHRAQVCAAHPAPDAARPRRRPSPHDPSRLRRPDVRWLISQYRLLRVMIRVPFGLRCLYPSPHKPSKAYSLCRQCTLRRPFAFVALTVYCARGRTVAHAVCTHARTLA